MTPDSSIDSKEACLFVSLKDNHLPSAVNFMNTQLPLTTRASQHQRPWLTPPLPSNLAWRGWVLAKPPMMKARPSRQPCTTGDFSLSANERSPQRSIRPRHGVSNSGQPHHGKNKPLRNFTPPMMTHWTPRSAARRRLERRRNRLHTWRRGSKYSLPRDRIGTTPSPLPNIDYPPKNINAEYKIDTSISDHPDYNKTITVFPPFINRFDSFLEYKTLMYWEVKAG